MHETWAAEPMHAKLFILYLLVVCCILVVRSLRLTRRLHSFSKKKRISPENIREGIATPELLAEYALTNRLLCELPPVGQSNPETPPPLAGEIVLLRTVQAAEDRFVYLWNECNAEVKSTKRLVVLTLFLSFLVVSYGAYPTFLGEFNNSKITGLQSLVYTGFLLLDRLARGLLVCTILYGVAILFEGALISRRARWNYFCARIRSLSVS